MAGIEEMQFGVRQVAQVGRRAVGGKDLVVLAPHDQRRRLPLAEERLKFRIERNVRSVVEEQVELDVLVARAVEQRLVVAPVVRIDPRDVGDAVRVLELRRLRRHEDVDRRAMRLRPVCPIGLDRIPERLEPFLIGVAVLHDEGGDALGMLEREPVADRRAVIHEIDRIVLDAELRQQAVDDVGVVAERVGERLVIGRGALAEARIVRRDDMVAIRERRDQIAEHVRRGRKAVQQQHGRRVGGSGFAVEDIDAVDLDGAIVDDRDRGLFRYAGRRARRGPAGAATDARSAAASAKARGGGLKRMSCLSDG